MKKLLFLLFSLTLLIACGDKATTEEGEKRLKVGYVVNQMGHEWYQNIVSGAKIRAEELGVELLTADSAMDINAEINACENFIEQQVDVLIITPTDPKALAAIVKRAKAEGIYILTESNVVDGADSYVGIKNYDGGKNAGLWYSQYAKDNNIEPKILIVGAPAFADCRDRVAGFKDGLKESGIEYEVVQEVDGGGSKEKSLSVVTDALTANENVNVIFGINDNSATGGLAAYKAAGLDEDKLTVIGFGFEGSVGQNALLSGGPYKAACAMFPNFVGFSLIDAAVEIASGKQLPDHYEIPTITITRDNFDTFYSKSGNGYAINFQAVKKLKK